MITTTPAVRLAPIFGISKQRAEEIETLMAKADQIKTSLKTVGLMQIWEIGKQVAKTPEEYALIGALIGEFQTTL